MSEKILKILLLSAAMATKLDVQMVITIVHVSSDAFRCCTDYNSFGFHRFTVY